MFELCSKEQDAGLNKRKLVETSGFLFSRFI
jgi:hypothetical protein